MVVNPAISDSTRSARTAHAPVIGLVGGVGSGKSTLARWMAARIFAGLIDVDAIGHQVLCDDRVRDQLRAAFGDAVFNASGQVDRPRLAAVVFGDSDAHQKSRLKLESIVHPVIHETIESQIREFQADPDCPCILLDAAILFEAGWQNRCDYVIFVDAPVELRRQRTASRGWDAETHRRREASQLSVDEKRRLADFTVGNADGIEQVGQLVLETLQSLGLLRLPVERT